MGLINQLITGGPHIVGFQPSGWWFIGFRWPIHSVFNSWPGHSIKSPAPMPSAPPPLRLSASQGMAAPRERLKRPCGMDGWVKSPIVYGPITIFCWWNLKIEWHKITNWGVLCPHCCRWNPDDCSLPLDFGVWSQIICWLNHLPSGNLT